MIQHWLTRPDQPIEQAYVKRFDPLHWTVDFPRGAMASVTRGNDPHSLIVRTCHYRQGDLIGLIFDSEDQHVHLAHRRGTSRDYSRCKLQFEWQSDGLIPLDAVHGPTLTLEGRDETGASRSWYVRLWNYAKGTPTSAEIALDFGDLRAGFSITDDAEQVYACDIDRLFISLAAPGYVSESSVRFADAVNATLTLSKIRSDGSGSVLALNDARTPEHGLRICTAYDDMYNLVPERVIESIERLGYRGVINHYVGMSHYFSVGPHGTVDDTKAFNQAAAAWHMAFAKAAAEHGYDVIWSVSLEILDMFCPEPWKQRHWNGEPALTGYDPPSTLVSPACEKAIDFLSLVASEMARMAQASGLRPRIQIGEPWWWIAPDHGPCIYDSDVRRRLDGRVVRIEEVRGEHTNGEKLLLEEAGALLAEGTSTICDRVRAAYPQVETLLLTYLPGSLRPDAPNLKDLNLPLGWSKPAFDVLQLEDYEWVTQGLTVMRREAIEQATSRLGYSAAEQHYLSGFVAGSDRAREWDLVVRAASEERSRGIAETFLWAFPQVVRDSLTLFNDEEDEVRSFDDVLFPIEIGAAASVSPAFSTSVVTSSSGFEFRNSNWTQARLRFDAGPGIRGNEEIERLIAFFRARRGNAVAFRFRDPFDFSSANMTGDPTPTDQRIGTGDGARTSFSLVKVYGEGEQRRITRPVVGTVKVSIDGHEVSDWVLEPGGVVRFEQPPHESAEIRAGFLFDVPVRFEEDRLEVARSSFRAGEAPSVPLIEVREVA